MRVNISYSAELDDVPYELARLVVDIASRMESESALLSKVEGLMTADSAVMNAAETAQLIDGVRSRMSQMDTRLGEAEAILGGYYQAKTNPEALLSRQQQDAEEDVMAPAQIDEALNGIQEDLQQIITESHDATSEESEHAEL